MKTILLLATILIGVLFPFTHEYSFLIKYLLMIMLFFSFLKMEVKKSDLQKNHLYLLSINLLVPITFYLIFRSIGNLQLAQVAFITAIAPTAIASPVIVNLLNGKIEFTVISILLTNFVIAFLLPFAIPFILNNNSAISSVDVLQPVAEIFLIPFFLSLVCKKYFPGISQILVKWNKYVFYILVLNINLGTAKASNYIKSEMSFSDPIIYQIAIVSLVLCILYFTIGKFIAPRNLKLEGSQSLGQKNNGFTVWVALTFISPLAVLGPVFYILFQNFYISWQLHKGQKKT
jgi:BASS family bile acid:Na+ symporter